MKLYESISPYYDHIFKFNPIQEEFIIASATEDSPVSTALEVGCGTGNLTIELAKHFKQIIGIDLDSEMLNIAKSKVSQTESNINFKCLNMMEIKKTFASSIFSMVFSFGNTLVHLSNLDNIRDFLKQTKTILKPGGKLLLQIINYDRILKKNIRHLPAIENEFIKFSRFYTHDQNHNKILFKTKLLIKETNRVIINKVELYPLLKQELEALLLETGYRNIYFFSSFKKEPLTDESVPLITEATL